MAKYIICISYQESWSKSDLQTIHSPIILPVTKIEADNTYITKFVALSPVFDEIYGEVTGVQGQGFFLNEFFFDQESNITVEVNESSRDYVAFVSLFDSIDS